MVNNKIARPFCSGFKVILRYICKKLEIFWIFGFFPKYLQLPGIEPAVLWLESQRTNHSANLPYYLLNLITPYLYCAATSSGPKKMRNVFVFETKKFFFGLVQRHYMIHV